MKARIYYGHGKWWCSRMGCTGCGDTPEAAWNDMWLVHRDAFVRPRVLIKNSDLRFA